MYGPRPIRFSAHWCADYSKYRGFLAGGISTASSLLPFFGTRLRHQNFNLAPTQYRQLHRLFTGRNAKNPQTETLRKRVTQLGKHNGQHVFPVVDTPRLFLFPSLRLRRNRTTFFACFRQVSFEGNTCFRQRIFVIAIADTRSNATETSLVFCFYQRIRTLNIRAKRDSALETSNFKMIPPFNCFFSFRVFFIAYCFVNSMQSDGCSSISLRRRQFLRDHYVLFCFTAWEKLGTTDGVHFIKHKIQSFHWNSSFISHKSYSGSIHKITCLIRF